MGVMELTMVAVAAAEGADFTAKAAAAAFFVAAAEEVGEVPSLAFLPGGSSPLIFL